LIDWGLLNAHPDIHRFTKFLVTARLIRDDINAEEMTLNHLLSQARLEWHGTRLGAPDWSSVSHAIAFTAWSVDKQVAFHYLFNAGWKKLTFELPYPEKMPGGHWHRWIDTSLVSPHDIALGDAMPKITDNIYYLPERPLAVLIAKATHTQLGQHV
jgi:glycogen operon protein